MIKKYIVCGKSGHTAWRCAKVPNPLEQTIEIDYSINLPSNWRKEDMVLCKLFGHKFGYWDGKESYCKRCFMFAKDYFNKGGL